MFHMEERDKPTPQGMMLSGKYIEFIPCNIIYKSCMFEKVFTCAKSILA
jgi:hypothetical protein